MTAKNKLLYDTLSLLNISSDDVEIDVDEEKNVFRITDTFIVSVCADESYELSFYVDIPEQSAFFYFQDEYCLLVLFAYIKKLFGADFTIEDYEGYPYRTVSYSYKKSDISQQELVSFLLSAIVFDAHIAILLEIIESLDPTIQNNDMYSKYIKVLESVKNDIEEYITLRDHKILKPYLRYISFINEITGVIELPENNKPCAPLFPYNFIGAESTNSSDYKKYKFYFSSTYELSQNSKEASCFFDVKGYLFFCIENTIYGAYDEGYNFINKLSELFGNSYHDDISLKLYVTNTNILVITNSLFTIEQKSYVKPGDVFFEDMVKKEFYAIKTNAEKMLNGTIFDPLTIIDSFIKLLMHEKTSEKQIEVFLQDNYQVIFGNDYDKAITQIKLIDVSDQRTIDLALHDKIKDDWVFIELKKANIKLTRRVRKIPAWRSEVTQALAQLRLYKGLLNNSTSQKYLQKHYDIEYKNPHFHLLIGGEDNDDFYRCQKQELDIEIKTYSYLYKTAKERLKFHFTEARKKDDI